MAKTDKGKISNISSKRGAAVVATPVPDGETIPMQYPDGESDSPAAALMDRVNGWEAAAEQNKIAVIDDGDAVDGEVMQSWPFASVAMAQIDAALDARSRYVLPRGGTDEEILAQVAAQVRTLDVELAAVFERGDRLLLLKGEILSAVKEKMGHGALTQIGNMLLISPRTVTNCIGYYKHRDRHFIREIDDKAVSFQTFSLLTNPDVRVESDRLVFELGDGEVEVLAVDEINALPRAQALDLIRNFKKIARKLETLSASVDGERDASRAKVAELTDENRRLKQTNDALMKERPDVDSYAALAREADEVLDRIEQIYRIFRTAREGDMEPETARHWFRLIERTRGLADNYDPRNDY